MSFISVVLCIFLVLSIISIVPVIREYFIYKARRAKHEAKIAENMELYQRTRIRRMIEKHQFNVDEFDKDFKNLK